MKIDSYNHKERYENWKSDIATSSMPNISKTNSDLIIQYVTDMEHELNVLIH